jgi:hypothetical protein
VVSASPGPSVARSGLARAALAAAALLVSAPSRAANPGVELGAQGGLWWSGAEQVAGSEAELPAATGGVIAPRLTGWLSDRVGLELDLPLALAGASGDRLRALGPRLSLRVDPLGEAGRVRPLLGAGLGVESRRWATTPWRDLPSPYARYGLTAHGAAGVVLPVAGALRLRVTVEAGVVALPSSLGWSAAPEVSVLVGFGTRFGLSADQDRDRIVDRDDACPTEAEDADGFRDDDGCPERDDDLDGVRDELDACDRDPEDLDGVDDEDGCPE